jgi:hypothetical protein
LLCIEGEEILELHGPYIVAKMERGELGQSREATASCINCHLPRAAAQIYNEVL